MGEWDDEKKDYKTRCMVRLDWDAWSKSRRDTFLREFNATREEAREESKADTQIKGWMFFVGTQDEFDPGVFHVGDHRLVCCLAAKYVWIKK